MELLDGWRTLAVLLMIPWHFLWDLTLLGLLPERFASSLGMELWRGVIAYSFILLAGISWRYSRSNLRRALRLALWAAAVSLATWMIGDPVKFGILHFMAAAVFLWGLLGEGLDRVSPRAGMFTAAAVFLPLQLWLRDFRISVPGLWALGFRRADFYSADYYPLLPWFFLFLVGAYGGRLLRERDGAWKRLRLPRALTWPGRHALEIYLIHQPVLYALALLCRRLAQ